MTKILRKSMEIHKVKFEKLSVSIGQKLMLRHYCIQNVEDEIQIRVYKINRESVNHFSQFTSVKLRKFKGNLRLIFGKSSEKMS